jgi:hypothetical protein
MKTGDADNATQPEQNGTGDVAIADETRMAEIS